MKNSNALRHEVNRLTDALIARGYSYTDVPALLPAKIIADMPGDTLRGRRLDVGDGQCLRVDLTVPLILAYAAEQSAQKVCAAGLVFTPLGESTQVGFEHFAEAAADTADAECLATVSALLPPQNMQVVFNNEAILQQLLGSLPLSDTQVARLCHAVRSRAGIEPLLQHYSEAAAEPRDDTMPLFALPSRGRVAGGRSSDLVNTRLAQRHSEPLTAPLTPEVLQLIRAIFAIKLPVAQAITHLQQLLQSAAVVNAQQASAACAQLQQWATQINGAMNSHDVVFDATLGRGIAYYTGLVFEVRNNGKLLAAGGRYNGLLRHNNLPVAAVGGAFFPTC